MSKMTLLKAGTSGQDSSAFLGGQGEEKMLRSIKEKGVRASQSQGNTAGDREHFARGHFDRLLQLSSRIFLNERFSPEAMLHRMS